MFSFYPILMMIVPQLNELLSVSFSSYSQFFFSVVLFFFFFSYRSNIGLRLIWLHTEEKKKEEGLLLHITHHFISKIHQHRKKRTSIRSKKKQLIKYIYKSNCRWNKWITKEWKNTGYIHDLNLKDYLTMKITFCFYLKTHSSVFIIFLYNFGCYHCYQHFSIVALEDNDGIDERKKKV
jgi:hypothetical protein